MSKPLSERLRMMLYEDIALEVEAMENALAVTKALLDEYKDGFKEVLDDHAQTLRKLDKTLNVLEANCIHIEEKWCWCEPFVESHAAKSVSEETDNG